MSSSLLNTIKDFAEDHEWYPTTDEQIQCVYRKIKELDVRGYSILDIGAGNGKVFDVLAQLGKNDPLQDQYSKVLPCDCYAIEKSKPLIDALPSHVFLVGSDFYEQTLIDKKVSVIFSNPPYSDYSQWATKVIKEANAPFVFLVLPKRWVFDQSIQEAIRTRKPSMKDDKLGYEILGSFDYLNAEDRKARARVDVVFIDLSANQRWHRDTLDVDPFNTWFDESYSGLSAPKDRVSEYEREKTNEENLKTKLEGELVNGQDVAQALVNLYQRDMNHLFGNFKAVSELDADIMQTLEVNVESIKSALKQRISSTKDRYWRELFDRLDKVTQKLTYASRTAMLGKLTANTSVDFNLSNIYAVLSWVFKNVNMYFDAQLIETYSKMIDHANIALYKSNQRVLSDFEWRYRKKPDNLTHFKLEYRLVLDRVGGIVRSDFSYDRSRFNGLTEGAAHFVDDLVTVANNLGFVCYENHRRYSWEPSKKFEFHYRDAKGSMRVLFEVRAFKNGNMHIRLAPKFAAALNVEFGRLKGWLNSAEQAADELDIDLKDAKASFRSNYLLDVKNVTNLLGFS